MIYLGNSNGCLDVNSWFHLRKVSSEINICWWLNSSNSCSWGYKFFISLWSALKWKKLFAYLKRINRCLVDVVNLSVFCVIFLRTVSNTLQLVPKKVMSPHPDSFEAAVTVFLMCTLKLGSLLRWTTRSPYINRFICFHICIA